MSEDPDSASLNVEVVLQDRGWLPLCQDVETAALKIATTVADHVAEFKRLPGPAEVAVVLGGDDYIRILNRDYRGIDAATNVLAFEQMGPDPERPAAAAAEGRTRPIPLGDVVLARETVEREARAQGKRFSDHFSHLLVHGLLHLVGYDHQVANEAQRMESIERAVLAHLGIADPYWDRVDERERWTTREPARRALEKKAAEMDDSTSGPKPHRDNDETRHTGVWNWLRGVFRGRNGDNALRETIEGIIEEIGEGEGEPELPVTIGDDERVMLANILKLQHLSAEDVMVPRADIVAVDVGAGLDELLELASRKGHSRLPVYRDTLDDVIGLVHIKDVLPYSRGKKRFRLSTITRTVLFVAPSMPVLDLLLEMRRTRVHMALVVDEFGGIDGLITTEDLVEEIVGEIEDEHDVSEQPKLLQRPDGTMIADARATVEDFEELVGPVLTEEEREEDIETLGGLVFSLSGRVPTRGELIVHGPTGISFEVLDADPRRIKRLRLRNLPGAATDGYASG